MKACLEVSPIKQGSIQKHIVKAQVINKRDNKRSAYTITIVELR